MSTYIMWINFVCNILMTLSFLCYTIFLFGRENSFVYKMRTINTVLLKIAICFCVTGSLYSVVTFCTPPMSEVILNCGLAMLFTWAAYFHYVTFVKVKVPELKITKKSKRK